MCASFIYFQTISRSTTKKGVLGSTHQQNVQLSSQNSIVKELGEHGRRKFVTIVERVLLTGA